MTISQQTWKKLRSLSERNRWPELVAAARAALAQDPEIGYGWWFLGEALLAQNQDHDALAAFENACTYSPTDGSAFRMRSFCLDRLERRPEAMRIAEIALTMTPEDASSHIRVSKLARQLGDFERAWSAARRAQELRPESSAVWRNLGWHASQEHRWADAHGHYLEALARDPEDGSLHQLLGTTLKWMDRRLEAAGAWRRAVICDPHEVGPYVDLSQILFEDGEELEAFDVLRRAVVAAPDMWSPRSTLVSKCLMYDRNDEALAVAEAAIEKFPRKPDAWCLLARCQERLRDPAAAERSLLRAIELAPKSGYALRMHAMQLDSLGRSTEALARAQEAVDAEKGEDSNWTLLATMQSRSGRPDLAVATLARLRVQFPNVSWILDNVAQMALVVGDLVEAQAAARELLVRRPKILRYWNRMVWVSWHVGDLGWTRELHAAVRAMPAERARFGIRMIRETTSQAEIYEAMIEQRWADAEVLVRTALEDASRVDDFACALVCALAIARARQGDREEASRLHRGGSVGPHATSRCTANDCPNVAWVGRVITERG